MKNKHPVLRRFMRRKVSVVAVSLKNLCGQLRLAFTAATCLMTLNRASDGNS